MVPSNVNLKDFEATIRGRGGDLFFIGKMSTISWDHEMSYSVEAPEVVYSLTGNMEKMVDIYLDLKTKDVSDLEEFMSSYYSKKQKIPSAIWTFARDCACCT
jgi:hypothetical protein